MAEEGIKINLISEESLRSIPDDERVRFILDQVKQGVVCVLETGLTAKEEAELIRLTMSEIDQDEFIGVEMQGVASTNVRKRGLIDRMLRRHAPRPRMSVIGPAQMLKTVYKDGNVVRAVILTKPEEEEAEEAGATEETEEIGVTPEEGEEPEGLPEEPMAVTSESQEIVGKSEAVEEEGMRGEITETETPTPSETETETELDTETETEPKSELGPEPEVEDGKEGEDEADLFEEDLEDWYDIEDVIELDDEDLSPGEPEQEETGSQSEPDSEEMTSNGIDTGTSTEPEPQDDRTQTDDSNHEVDEQADSENGNEEDKKENTPEE